jgi:hypothetical protein
MIIRKLETEEKKKRSYFEDPDNPPIPNDFKTFQFVEINNYMTDNGAVTFNLDYVIRMSKNIQIIREKEQKITIDKEGKTPTRETLFDWRE